MDKAMDMGKSSATGSFHLLIGVAVSTLIMFFGTFVLAKLLSDAELGLYGVALIPSSMIGFFRDWGVNSAMTQQIASLRAARKDAEIHDVIVSGVIFEIASGAALSLLCFGLAETLAAVLQRPTASAFISIMSLSIFAGAILAAATSIFVGFERMKLNSLTTIFQAVVKTALGPLLVILGYSVLGAVIAATVSIIAGGIVGILIVYFALFRPLRRSKKGKCKVPKTLKPMLKYGVPLTVSNITVGVTPQVFAFMMALYAGDSTMGNYYAASYFPVLLTFFSIPISTALFPAFAKLNPQEEPELLKKVFASSIKYTSVLLVPATMVMMALSTPIVYTLFGAKFPYAPLFLALSVIINLYAVVGSLSLGTFQTGIGETNRLMMQSMLSLLVGLPIGFLLVLSLDLVGGPPFAVVGGILGILISTAPGMIWGLYWIWKRYHIKADFVTSAKIVVASSIAAALTFAFLSVFFAAAWIMLVLGFVIFLVVYLACAPLMGAVNQTDVDNLRAMFSGLVIVSDLLEIPFRFVEKFLKLRSRQNSEKREVIR